MTQRYAPENFTSFSFQIWNSAFVLGGEAPSWKEMSSGMSVSSVEDVSDADELENAVDPSAAKDISSICGADAYLRPSSRRLPLSGSTPPCAAPSAVKVAAGYSIAELLR